jgi:hypothetical protein
MSSDLYEGTSISAMCQEVRQWSSQVPVGSDRDKRRKKIEPIIRSIVALPERLNTESCIEVIFVAHRIVPLVSSSNWAEYLFVFGIASSQLQTSLSTEANIHRWLEYHEGGVELIPSQITNLLAIIRDAHLVLTSVSAALAKALATIIVTTLLPVTYKWQSPEKISQVWRNVNGLFPPSGGLFFFTSCMLEDCSASARFVKRGIFQAKVDQEEEFSANSHLRLALVMFLQELMKFPIAEANETVQCIAQLDNILWEPHYKARDSQLVTHVIHLLSNATPSRFVERVTISLFHKLCTAVKNLSGVTNVAPARDVVKERWMQTQCGVENFPLWSPIVVREIFALSATLIQSAPELVFELIVGLVSALPGESTQGVVPQFILHNRKTFSFMRSRDSDGTFFNACVSTCVRDAVTSSALVSLSLEALSVLVAEECRVLRTGALRSVGIGFLQQHLMKLQEYLLQELPTPITFIQLLRTWIRYLQLNLLLEVQTPNPHKLTFGPMFASITEVKDFSALVKIRCPGQLLDNELLLLQQENAVTATSLWRTLGVTDSNSSLLLAITELISLI